MLFIPSPTFAQTKQEAWVRALASDVDDYEDWNLRQDNKDLYLRAFGDFDGDGRQDEAYLAKNVAAGQYGVFVKLAKADAPIELDWGELKSLPRVGLYELKPGKYSDFCARMRNRPADCVPHVSIPNEAFAVVYFEASSLTHYFKYGKWETVWTSD
jgi:hypothetical protein